MSAAEELRTVTISKGEITYDPDMPIGTIKALMGAGESGDLEGMQVALGKLITSWPFEGDVDDIEAWDALRRSEFMEITQAVMEDFGKLGEA